MEFKIVNGVSMAVGTAEEIKEYSKSRASMLSDSPKIEPEYKKFDSGKPRTDLLGPTSILEMASVLGFGANKYSADNWKNCTEPERFLAASLRHILQYMNGEKVDSETGISHLAHAMTSLMFVRELEVLNEKK